MNGPIFIECKIKMATEKILGDLKRNQLKIKLNL